MARTRRIKRGGMFPSPSQKRKSLYKMQRMLGDENSSRPFGKQNMQLTRLAEETAFPRNISKDEKTCMDF